MPCVRQKTHQNKQRSYTKGKRVCPKALTSPTTAHTSMTSQIYRITSQSPSPTPLHKMHCSLFLVAAVALLQLSSSKILAFDIGIGGGVWIDGRGMTAATGQSPPPAPSTTGSSSEYSALQAWKSAITDDPNGILTTWVGPDVCVYKGIYCSEPPEDTSADTVVRGIDLNGANLKGALVDDLSLLSHLSIIHLNSNRFTGIIPNTFRDLRFLTELDLSNNQFAGAFPAATLLIPNLIYLDLRFNSFTGEIPDDLFIKELDAIFLNNNQFDGELPMSLWVSPASVITLANNALSGQLPPGFGYMGGNAREILLLNNRLTGCIPEGVGYISNLEVLDFSYNDLTGHLPGTLSCLSGIEVLNIAHNQLSGELPDLVCDLKRLANLTVAYNFFSGFSQDCNKLSFRGFDFVGNCIPGRDMQRPPPECMGAPGGGLSCMRIPLGRPPCGGGMGGGFGFAVPGNTADTVAP